jgi:hypothetical protein
LEGLSKARAKDFAKFIVLQNGPRSIHAGLPISKPIRNAKGKSAEHRIARMFWAGLKA